jgi:hypothetical protein
MKRIYTDERVAELRESLETEPASLAKTLALTLLNDVARYEDALEQADKARRIGENADPGDALETVNTMLCWLDEVNNGA